MEYLKNHFDDFVSEAKLKNNLYYDGSLDLVSTENYSADPKNEQQLMNHFIQKYVKNNIPTNKVHILVEGIVIPVVIMMFSLGRTDVPLMWKLFITILVVVHIIVISKSVLMARAVV